MHPESSNSPASATLEELIRVRDRFREALSAYQRVWEEEFLSLEDHLRVVVDQGASSSQLRDLRDIRSILLKSSEKPPKGKRKELKKLEEIVEDLKIVTESWS